MDFISYFTKNTRVSILLSLILLLFGFLGFRQLKSESIPSVDFGTVVILTSYPGASPGVYSLNSSTGVFTLGTSYPIRQTIEGINITGGTYALSWTGTASCKIVEGVNPTSGTTSSSPITVTLNAGVEASVDCGNGTLSNVQLVKGSVAIPFQKRSIGLETLLAARYYESGSHSVSQPGFASGALGGVGNVSFSVEKRVNPIAVRVYGNGVLDRVRNDNTGATEGSMALGSSSPKHFTVRSTSNLTSGVQYSFSWQVDADFPPN